MDVRESGTWVQCTMCGRVYYIKESVPIDKMYVDAACPKCDNERAINCGDKEEDVILYCDSYLDGRFYEY